MVDNDKLVLLTKDLNFVIVVLILDVLKNMAKKANKKKVVEDEIDALVSIDDDGLEIDEPEIISEDDQVEDDTAYTMGDIVVDDGSSDEADEDERILQAAPTTSATEEEEDDEVWVDDVNVFDDDDPYLEGQDFDPDNADGYYD